MNSKTRHPILSWEPGWQEVCANQQLMRTLERLVGQVRRMPEDMEPLQQHFVGLVTGPSRAGKTAAIQLFVRTLICRQIDSDTMQPCGLCFACTTNWRTDGIRGTWAALYGDARQRKVSISYSPIDCTRTTASDLAERLLMIEQDASHLRLVFLDEVHRLVQHQLDEKLLKVVEQTPAIWLLATAHPEELEDMLVKRCHKLHTELPKASEMFSWLEARCQQFGLLFTPVGLHRLVERSNRVPGVALRCLALAQTLGSEITYEFVDLDWTP